MLCEAILADREDTCRIKRERLQVMNLTADGQTVMENRYRYDAVDNILDITNAANATSLTKLNKAKLGGKSSHTYEYDELNRLVHASGKAKRASYDMVMSFGRMSEPLRRRGVSSILRLTSWTSLMHSGVAVTSSSASCASPLIHS